MMTNDYPENSQATTVLVLGILSIVLTITCAIGVLIGPFAWVMGNKELAGIDAGRRPPQNRSTAQAGKIMGVVSTVLGLIGIALVFMLVVVGIIGSAT